MLGRAAFYIQKLALLLPIDAWNYICVWGNKYIQRKKVFGTTEEKIDYSLD